MSCFGVYLLGGKKPSSLFTSLLLVFVTIFFWLLLRLLFPRLGLFSFMLMFCFLVEVTFACMLQVQDFGLRTLVSAPKMVVRVALLCR